ncbi:MAG: phosphoribosylglycinamide formyltransferase [Gammaproteobacteria bacterium]|nr:phosphoribosylglycinamide formyltransferase [Gammaproteobacteria bacterium]
MSGAGRRARTVVLVSGGGSNLQAIIDRNAGGALGLELAGVLSDRPGVRALERAAAAGIPSMVVDFAEAGTREAFAQRLAVALDGLQPDIVVLAGFMRILAHDLVNRYLGRMLNVHPSLLPLYPGLDTYRRALAAGDAWHGSTVHFVTPDLDGGPAIVQYRVRIRTGDTADTLRERVQRGEHRVYPDAIGWLAKGRLGWRDSRAWLDGRPLAAPLQVDEPDGP